MRVLGIDTSTLCGSIGLIEVEQILCEYTLNGKMSHSERVLKTIDRVLEDSGVAIGDIDGFAISIGPGSFTGLRIGVSVVKGLAFATGKPVAGVSTLDAIAQNVRYSPYLICPVLDARKGEIYAALYRNSGKNGLIKVAPEIAIKPDELFERIDEEALFLGNGVYSYGDLIRRELGEMAHIAPPLFNFVHGVVVAQLGRQKLEEGQYLDMEGFVPQYLRKSDAELRWEKKMGKSS
ncbi:MAG: tRNA (adenosine(37)-N6)-threonylcarbamoyltransferase complex dimerization subunit type 1 TsaB [Syntrophobacterales bacterium]|nr:MAG: tRNA (adenosine(37)-N6)-threonylcarbamoyltransferase complex dimerization subunit type 1 TsaB [Syntrophobacterales bacterium]